MTSTPPWPGPSDQQPVQYPGPPWSPNPGPNDHGPYPQSPHQPAPYQPPYAEQPTGRTSFWKAWGAGVMWAGVHLILAMVVNIAVQGGAPTGHWLGFMIGSALIPSLVAGLAAWGFLRRKQVSFVVVAAVALPFYFIVRAVLTAAAAAS
ncbi:hypothetical protein WEH80_14950 [Actinomycetes bacterium KLBMP 9759]